MNFLSKFTYFKIDKRNPLLNTHYKLRNVMVSVTVFQFDSVRF